MNWFAKLLAVLWKALTSGRKRKDEKRGYEFFWFL